MKRIFTLILSIGLLILFSSLSHARYYCPQTGRYLTPDPIGLEGGINPYVYVLNDPVNFVDPEGLAPVNINGDFLTPDDDVNFCEALDMGSSQDYMKQSILDLVLSFGPTIITWGMIPPIPTLKPKPISTPAKLGFKLRIPPQKAPFNSHGQPVFSNGKKFITRDIDQHKGGAWKMFDRKGRRLGTYDRKLNRIGD